MTIKAGGMESTGKKKGNFYARIAFSFFEGGIVSIRP